MDSCEHISNDILSYLTDNVRETDSSLIDMESIPDYVSTTTECGVTDASEIENSLNPPVNPALSSVKSPFSSKRLEWDSGADVGYVNAKGQAEFATTHSKLSTIEKMALSSSASKLCFIDEDYDDDDHSQALIAKIDMLLGKNKTERRLPTWPSVDSSNGSMDTVVPLQMRPTLRDGIQLANPKPVFKTRNAEIQTSPISFADGSTVSEFKYYSPKVFQLNNDQETALSRSEYVAGMKEQHNVSSAREMHVIRTLHYSHSSITDCSTSEASLSFHEGVGQNGLDSVEKPLLQKPDDLSDNELKCVSGHQVVERRLGERLHFKNQRKAKSELEVCKTLREHLKSLKNYVIQLEKTWQFLGNVSDVSKSNSSSKSASIKNYKSNSSRISNSQTSKSVSSISSSSHYQRSKSLVQKNEISFEIEPLDLQGSDSETSNTTRKAKYSPKTDDSSKCCSHCELRLKGRKNSKISARSSTVTEVQQDTPKIVSYQSSNKMVEAQKEPISFEIPLKSSKNKLSLQEALSSRRPDFISRSEARRNAIHQMVEMRQDENVPSNHIPRLFTYQQLRRHTERIYQQLPEVKNKTNNKVKNNRGTSNRIKAAVFQKELQSRVLQGQLNLPHSTCLVNCR